MCVFFYTTFFFGLFNSYVKASDGSAFCSSFASIITTEFSSSKITLEGYSGENEGYSGELVQKKLPKRLLCESRQIKDFFKETLEEFNIRNIQDVNVIVGGEWSCDIRSDVAYIILPYNKQTDDSLIRNLYALINIKVPVQGDVDELSRLIMLKQGIERGKSYDFISLRQVQEGLDDYRYFVCKSLFEKAFIDKEWIQCLSKAGSMCAKKEFGFEGSCVAAVMSQMILDSGINYLNNRNRNHTIDTAIRLKNDARLTAAHRRFLERERDNSTIYPHKRILPNRWNGVDAINKRLDAFPSE